MTQISFYALALTFAANARLTHELDKTRSKRVAIVLGHSKLDNYEHSSE